MSKPRITQTKGTPDTMTYYNDSGVATEIPHGTNGQVLAMDVVAPVIGDDATYPNVTGLGTATLTLTFDATYDRALDYLDNTTFGPASPDFTSPLVMAVGDYGSNNSIGNPVKLIHTSTACGGFPYDYPTCLATGVALGDPAGYYVDGGIWRSASGGGETAGSTAPDWVSLSEGTVTSVGITVPTGLTATGSPVTTAGDIDIELENGYEIPTTASLNEKQLAVRSTRMGWLFPDDTIDPTADLTANKWHTVSCLWYELESDGDFLKRDTSTFGTNFYYTAANAELVRQNATVALVNVTSGNATGVNALTTSSAKRSALITEMLSFCQTNNFDGVDLDLETFQVGSMSAAQWIDFKTMLRELGDALHAKGLMLSMEVPPVWNTAANTESGSGDAWDSADSEAYYRLRYAELNDLPVDQVVVMVYDYQFDYGTGQPTQPLKWLKETLEYSRSQFNEDKIKLVAGLPSAGYQGTASSYSSTGLTYDAGILVTGFGGASRDVSSGEILWSNGGNEYCVIDDIAVQQKVAQAEEVGVFAYSLWHMGDNQYGGTGLSTINPDHKKFNGTGATRVSTEASSATPTINTDAVDCHSITALATAITSMTTNLSGTPSNFQRLLIRIKDNGTARAITWGASFQDGSVALPTTTVLGKTLLVGLIYDSVDGKWTCEASGSRA